MGPIKIEEHSVAVSIHIQPTDGLLMHEGPLCKRAVSTCSLMGWPDQGWDCCSCTRSSLWCCGRSSRASKEVPPAIDVVSCWQEAAALARLACDRNSSRSTHSVRKPLAEKQGHIGEQRGERSSYPERQSRCSGAAWVWLLGPSSKSCNSRPGSAVAQAVVA